MMRRQTVDKVHGSCRGFFFATEIRGYASAIERRRQAPAVCRQGCFFGYFFYTITPANAHKYYVFWYNRCMDGPAYDDTK